MRLLPVFLWLCFLSGGAPAAPPVCPDFGPMTDLNDYWSVQDRYKSGGIATNEAYHFNADVEALRRGQAASLGTDLVYMLRFTPNHARALNALSRLSLRDRTPQPAGTLMSTECWLYRATVFRPDDGLAKMIYGNHLARLGRTREALALLKEADTLKPDNGNIKYNLGLVYFEVRDYDQARNYARQAAELGFPLTGLKQKLEKSGQWRN